MPQVSVIIPVYKAEKYLEKCVRSVLNQTFHDLELVLVDDGSPDHSSAMCDRFAVEDNRVHVIHQKNAGVAAARNAGLSVVCGEYVTFVDSDDFIEPDMYAAMMGIARKHDCDVVMCDCIKEFGDHTEIYSHNIRPGYYDRKQLETEYFPHLLIMPNVEYPPTISNWLCLFRYDKDRESYLHYEEGIRYSEDLLFGAQMMYKAQSFYYMKGRTFYHYNCANQQSTTHTFVTDKWYDYKMLHQRIREYFESCPEYDFREQIDKVLLFFVYNATGEILETKALSYQQKIKAVKNILQEEIVREMFKRLTIRYLGISTKQRLLTWCYAHPVTVPLLVCYVSKKKG